VYEGMRVLHQGTERGVAVGQVVGKVCDRMCQGSVCEVERASM
jgi:hypothetical protein